MLFFFNFFYCKIESGGSGTPCPDYTLLQRRKHEMLKRVKKVFVLFVILSTLLTSIETIGEIVGGNTVSTCGDDKPTPSGLGGSKGDDDTVSHDVYFHF